MAMGSNVTGCAFSMSNICVFSVKELWLWGKNLSSGGFIHVLGEWLPQKNGWRAVMLGVMSRWDKPPGVTRRRLDPTDKLFRSRQGSLRLFDIENHRKTKNVILYACWS